MARLTRRKVVQWGIVYVAGAWGFLQGPEYLSGTYDWPRQIQQLVTLALLIGLPIVLVLAWYHGDAVSSGSPSEFVIVDAAPAARVAGRSVLPSCQRR